jgi:hypothetical protein
MTNESKPKPTVTTPSMMKIQAQPGRPPLPSRRSIAAARRPPKDPETAAAEKKIAYSCQHVEKERELDKLLLELRTPNACTNTREGN